MLSRDAAREKASVLVDAHVEVVVWEGTDDEIPKIYPITQARDEQFRVVLQAAICEGKNSALAVEALADTLRCGASDLEFNGEMGAWPHVKPNG